MVQLSKTKMINRGLYIIGFILIVGCKENSKLINCNATHESIIRNDDLDEIRVIRNCDNKLLYSQEGILISKDSFISQGAYREFYESGYLKVLSFFKKNIQDSVMIKYRSDKSIEFRNYYVDGMKKGFQNYYYNSGKIEMQNYHKNDSQIICKILYDSTGSISDINGQILRVDLNKTPDNYVVGDQLFIKNEILVVDQFRPRLCIVFRSKTGQNIIDTVVESFQYIDNRFWKMLCIKADQEGVYQYSAVATWLDKSKLKIIKGDSIAFSIKVGR